jgi:D-serine deaminase-like pyridoxal phosphate-dependent protein
MPIDFSRLQVFTTPLLVLVRKTLERNLDVMQARCDAAGVKLRAHGKMHKCSTLAKLQIAKGAVGVCAQTVGEAEAFAGSGIANILLTSPASLKDVRRVAALATCGKFAAVVDDRILAEALGAAARARGVVLDLLVDIDLGQRRTGVRANEVVDFAGTIEAISGTRFAGVQGYAGHLQHISDTRARTLANGKALGVLAAIVNNLRAANLEPETVSGGGTGTHTSDLASGVFTEIQAGSYAVMDVQYGACGSPDGGAWPFSAALALASTVVSARHRTHVTVDAGFKALSADGPPAKILSGAAAGSQWFGMGDEHGAIFHPAALRALEGSWQDPLVLEAGIAAADVELPPPLDAPRLGGTVWLQPGHCDPTINLHDAFFVVEPDGAWTRWPIDARRRTFEPAASTGAQ